MRKRDYPPTFFYHQPWWKYFRTVEDYFARACLFTTLGRPVREVLLLHSISSGWAAPHSAGERRRHGDNLNRTAEDLLALHYDFDLGDETVMSDYGLVADGRLRVGEASYRLLVIPECDTLLRSTVKLTREFLDSGGKVICMGRGPIRVEGKPAPELEALLSHERATKIAPKREELADALRAALPRRVSITAEAGQEVSSVIYQERTHQGRRYVMLANRDRESGHRLNVELSGEGAVEHWDLETGKTTALSARASAGRTVVSLDLPPSGSTALVLDPAAKVVERPRRLPQAVRETVLADEWQVRRSMENSLPLDRCEWRFAGEGRSEPMPVFLAQKQMRERMGLQDISHSNIPQPWVHYAEPSSVPSRSVEVRFAFRVDEMPPNGIDLVVESVELFEIEVNGKAIEAASSGWWLDRSMDRVPLDNIRLGENELLLRCEYRDAPEYEIEECYLIGSFGVDRSTDAIASEPGRLRTGDWCDQGYPYYAGNLFYGQEIDLHLKSREKARLTIGPHFGACAAVHVNGKLAGVRGWPPYEVDVTRCLEPGRNLIEVEICGSPRNLLGPNHLPEKRPAWTGPWEFIRLGEWVEERNLVPYGLFGDVVLTIAR
jgi:hypothetical protein